MIWSDMGSFIRLLWFGDGSCEDQQAIRSRRNRQGWVLPVPAPPDRRWDGFMGQITVKKDRLFSFFRRYGKCFASAVSGLRRDNSYSSCSRRQFSQARILPPPKIRACLRYGGGVCRNACFACCRCLAKSIRNGSAFWTFPRRTRVIRRIPCMQLM